MTPLTRALVLNYTLVYVLAMLAVGLIAYGLQRYAGFESGGGLGIVPVIAGAMFAGHIYHKRQAHRPANGEAWRYAMVFVLISLVISSIASVLLLPMGEILASVGPAILILLAVVLLIHILAARVFFGMGAKQAAKAQKTPQR